MSTLSVSFKGNTLSVHDISIESCTLEDLSNRLSELTNVPSAAQKLLWKGRKANTSPETTLFDAGIREGVRIMLMGTPVTELNEFKQAESEANRRQAILAHRAASGPSKIRSTTKPSSESAKYTFMRIEPLAHLPKPTEATRILTKLANDPAIRHVMAQHQFTVGLLTELAPHEHPNLLGLNENAGQAIKLRIRTDAYDGFRLYSEIRRVSLHELTHNVWGDHDDNFKKLNSQLNKEVAQYEAAVREGSHSLSGMEGGYEPESADVLAGRSGLIGGVNVLGGGSNSPKPLTVEERRAKIVEAVMRRFEEQEAEIEDRCAT